MDEVGVYIVSNNRSGYGESDPNPKRSVRNEAFEIQELVDQLQLRCKFYLLGMSLGTYPVWACLRYIPHRKATFQFPTSIFMAFLVFSSANFSSMKLY
jgi:hypothetical protein